MSTNIKSVFKNPLLLFLTLGHRGLFNWINDETYLKIAWYVRMHKKLNLDDPQTFNEKLQWMKLYDRRPEYTKMVDKYEVKKYVAEKIGEEIIIPTLGVWDCFDDIDFGDLPRQFVLKCTHDSGGIVICRDKNKLDIQAARKKINNCLKHNYFYGMREWPYKNVKPRIIAEVYMSDNSCQDLRDYKFYCFDGTPRFLYISQGLENHDTAQISFIDCDWNFSPYKRSDYAPFETLPEKPEKFDEMMNLAAKLSENYPFLRVDLYQIKGKVYFSELTFFPCSGFMPFKDPRHDKEIGEMIKLPLKSIESNRKV